MSSSAPQKADQKPAKQPSGALADLGVIKRLWTYARDDARLYLLAACIAPLTIGLAMVQPLLVKRALDDHITPGELAGLPEVAGLYLGAVLLSFVLEAGYTLSLATAGQRSLVRIREAIYRHLLSRAARFFDTRPAGALLTRATTDVEAIAEALQSGLLSLALDALRVLGALGVMIWLDWRLTVVLLAIAPPLLLLLELCRRNLRKLFTVVRDSLATLNGFLAERLAGVEIVQLFNEEPATNERFRSLNTVYRNAAVQSNVWDAFMFALVDGVGSMCVALMLWYGTSDFVAGAVSAGLLAAFIDYLDRLFRPLRQFSQQVAVIQRSLTAMEKIFALMDDTTAIPSGGADPKDIRGRVRFEDVRFGYVEGEDVIKGVSFEVAPGQVVALVGPTGCGKSTLIRLLSRTYDGYRGRIELDGHEITELDVAAVRRHVAAVHQDVHLFPDTLRFNVSMGDPSLSQAQLDDAVALVQADGFIDELGWDHRVEERGANLSVGQGQLVTFARTMAYDPEVVVLDEATASVDPVTEALIQEAIQRILARKTAIVVAHRLSTITAADQILVLDAGRVVERGTHEELLAQGGRYAELYEMGFSHS